MDNPKTTTNTRLPRIGGGSRLVTLTLLEDQTRTTTLITPTTEILMPELEPSITARLEDVLFHVRCLDRTPDFRFAITSTMSWDGFNWETGVTNYMDYATDSAVLKDYAIGAATTDRTAFGRYVRFSLSYQRRNSGSTETKSSARLSIVAYLKTWGQ